MDVASVIGFLLDIGVFNVEIFEFEGQLVDCDDIFSGEVLKGSGQKGLREEET